MAGMFDDLIPTSEGGPLKITVRPPVPPEGKAVLDAIAGSESPGYDVMYGGGKFGDFSDHPRQLVPIANGPNAGKKSSAAGRYQFLQGTWDETAGELGLKDFSPENQDAAAWHLAQKTYKTKTGRELAEDIKKANGNSSALNGIGRYLSGTWTSLPGGIEPNKATEGFGQRAATSYAPTDLSGQARVPEGSAGLFDDLIPKAATFDARFTTAAPAANPALAGQLQLAAAKMRETGNPASSAGQELAIGFLNQGSAAGQGTSPSTAVHAQNLLSNEVHQSDSGELLFKDRSGQLIPTDQNKHVVLRDPADNTLKVYARTAATDEGRLSSAGRLLSTGMAAGASTARPSIPAPNTAIQPKASDIFSAAKPHYREFAREAGKVEIPVQTAADLAERIRGSLDKANLIQELAPSVYSAVGILDKGKPLTVDVLQNIKRVVGRSFNSPDKNVRDAAAVASGEISKIISEVSPAAGQSLKTADAIHSTARSVQDLQRKGDVADLRAGRAGYGGNAVNSMRQVLSPIVQRAVEGRTTGFKPAEIQAMRDIVEGTTATNALRGVGQLSPSKGIIQTVGAGGAMYAAGPVALVIPALGAASNKLATVLTGKQIDRLKELVAKRSPAYAEAVTKAVDRYEKAQLELVNKPSSASLGGYVSASRSLSSGLSRDGVPVSSADLMRSLQAASVGRAEEDQQEIPRPPSQ